MAKLKHESDVRVILHDLAISFHLRFRWTRTYDILSYVILPCVLIQLFLFVLHVVFLYVEILRYTFLGALRTDHMTA